MNTPLSEVQTELYLPQYHFLLPYHQRRYNPLFCGHLQLTHMCALAVLSYQYVKQQ